MLNKLVFVSLQKAYTDEAFLEGAIFHHPLSYKGMAYIYIYIYIYILYIHSTSLYLHTFIYVCTCMLSCFSSVQFRHSVVSESLRPHELQHARPPCPSPTPGVHSNSGPSSQWCHPAISSSIVPFSSCPQSLPASESIPMSQLFAWGSQSTGVSA